MAGGAQGCSFLAQASHTALGPSWFLFSSVPQAPHVLGGTGSPFLGSGLQTRVKGQVPPTGAQSHQGRGCSH